MSPLAGLITWIIAILIPTVIVMLGMPDT